MHMAQNSEVQKGIQSKLNLPSIPVPQLPRGNQCYYFVNPSGEYTFK